MESTLNQCSIIILVKATLTEPKCSRSVFAIRSLKQYESSGSHAIFELIINDMILQQKIYLGFLQHDNAAVEVKL